MACKCNERRFSFQCRSIVGECVRFIAFRAGYICEEPSYMQSHGVGCVSLVFAVRKEDIAVELSIHTGWYPKNVDRPLPVSAIKGRSSALHIHRASEEGCDDCPLLGDKKRCKITTPFMTTYEDEIFEILKVQGEDALFEKLTEILYDADKS